MLKLFIVLLIYMLSGHSLLAQTSSNYPTELVRIDSTHVLLRKQEFDFILGQEFPQIVINDVLYHKQANTYMVYGFVDDVNYNGADSYKVKIDVLNGDNIVYTTYSSRNGVFAISIKKGEKARFTGDLYIDLIIQ